MRRVIVRLLSSAILLLISLQGAPVFADPGAAKWAAAQIKSIGTANFDQAPACQKASSITPGLADDTSPSPQNRTANWANPCRTITDQQLLSLLQIHRPDRLVVLEGVNIRTGVRTDIKTKTQVLSTILSGRNFENGLSILYGTIGPRLNIDGSNFHSLDLENVDFLGAMNAENVVVDTAVKLDNLYLGGLMDLTSLKAGSYLTLSTVRCDGCSVDAQNLNIAGNFYIKHDLGLRTGIAGVKNDFSNSIFARSFYLIDAQIYQTLDCFSCTIGGGLYIQKSVDDETPATRLADFMGPVDFTGTRIGGDITIRDARFENFLSFDTISAENFKIMSGTSLQQLLLRDATLVGSLLTDPSQNLKVSEIRLSGTSIGKELDLSGFDYNSWQYDPGVPQSPLLDLTDVSTGVFTDCINSFPNQLLLDGFTYGDYRHAQAESDHKDYKIYLQSNLDDPNLQDTAWLAWLAKSRDTSEFPGAKIGIYNPQPYLFLAKLLAAEGYTSYSNEILLQSRKNEIRDTWHQANYVSWFGLEFLYVIAGFGIGYYLLWHITLVIVFSLTCGILGLKCFGDTKKMSLPWCLFAAIDHLLPVVNLSDEFKDFFDGKSDIKPTPGQKFGFFLYAMWGWIVSALLVTAISGLTQGG